MEYRDTETQRIDCSDEKISSVTPCLCIPNFEKQQSNPLVKCFSSCLVQNLIDEFLQQITITGRGVSYSFRTGIALSDVTDDVHYLYS